MYKRAVHYLQGSEWVEIQCACPERVLNLLGARGIVFWDLTWESEICLRLRMLLRQEALLREIAEQTGAEITVVSRGGVPLLWARFKRRYVLLAGLAVFWLLLFGGNLFIWEFRVSGNENVPTETVLRALENYGITIGSQGMHIDQEDMRNHVLLELHDVSWLTVNVKGCVAYVQVVERQRPPEIAQEDGVWNIVAARDGLVTQVRALNGKALVAAGSTVTEGQLLVTGIYETRDQRTYMTHSLGTVEARTWYELSVSVPLEVTEKSGEKQERTAISIDFGKKRIKLWGRGSICGANCDKITYYHPLSLPVGLRLPVTLVKETVTAYEGQTLRRSREEAQKEGENLLLQQLKAQLDESSTITETKFSAAVEGDFLLVVLQAECLEQIGRPVQVQQAEESN